MRWCCADLGLVGGVGFGEDDQHVAEGLDHGGDFVPGRPPVGVVGGLAELAFGGSAFGLGLCDPAGDEGRVGAGFQCGPVAGDLGRAVFDRAVGAVGGLVVSGWPGLGRGHGVEGVGEPRRFQRGGEPAVQGGYDGVFADVDVAGPSWRYRHTG